MARADSAYEAAARDALPTFAAEAARASNFDAVETLRAVTNVAKWFASSHDITAAVSNSLGVPALPGAVELVEFFRRDADALQELKSRGDGLAREAYELLAIAENPEGAFDAFRNELADFSDLWAMRDAPSVLATLRQGGDFAAALVDKHRYLRPDSAAAIARRTLVALAQTPQPRTETVISEDPFEERLVEPDAATLALHEKAKIMNIATHQFTHCCDKFDLETEPGLLGDIARWSQTFAYRPVKEFAQPAALATLAAIFGRRWATPTGLGINLYVVGLGETSGGKDALVTAPRVLLSAAKLDNLVGKGDFASDSAIEKEVRRKPVHLMPVDEMGKLVQAMMGRQAQGFARLAAKALLELYPRSQPGSAWTGKARAGDEEELPPVQAPTLSILGVSTVEDFFEGMSQAALRDGFLNRLTLVKGGRPGARQRDPARLTPPSALLDNIRAAIRGDSGNLSGIVGDPAARPVIRFASWADADAIRALESVEEWEDDARDAGRAGVAGRAAEQTQKVATLRALSRDPAAPVVTASDIRWAWTFVRSSIEEIEAGASQMMHDSEFGALVAAVEAATIEAGADGLSWSKLLERRGVGKHVPKLVEAAVDRLKERGAVTVGLMTGPQGGRPDKRIRATAFG